MFPVSLCFVYCFSCLLACFILHINSQFSRKGITRRPYRRANNKRAHRWRRRALPFALVVRCRKRARCRPARLDGSQFLSPSISKHLRWMKGHLHAWAFFNSRSNSMVLNRLVEFHTPSWTDSCDLMCIFFSSQGSCHNFDQLIMRRTSPLALLG